MSIIFQSYDTKQFGSYLRKLRNNLNLTQKYVEEVSGVNCDTLRKIESSLVIPRYETLEYLSMAYKVDLLINIDEKTIYKWRDFIFY